MYIQFQIFAHKSLQSIINTSKYYIINRFIYIIYNFLRPKRMFKLIDEQNKNNVHSMYQ